MNFQVSIFALIFWKSQVSWTKSILYTLNHVQVTICHTASIQTINKVSKKWFILQCHQTLYSMSRGNIIFSLLFSCSVFYCRYTMINELCLFFVHYKVMLKLLYNCITFCCRTTDLLLCVWLNK